MVTGKMLINESHKYFTNVSFHIRTIITKLAIVVEKQIVLWMVTVFLNALFAKHLLVQLPINITMVLVKISSKNVTITIIVFLEINLVKRTLNSPSTYGN